MRCRNTRRSKPRGTYAWHCSVCTASCHTPTELVQPLPHELDSHHHSLGAGPLGRGGRRGRWWEEGRGAAAAPRPRAKAARGRVRPAVQQTSSESRARRSAHTGGELESTTCNPGRTVRGYPGSMAFSFSRNSEMERLGVVQAAPPALHPAWLLPHISPLSVFLGNCALPGLTVCLCLCSWPP